MATSLPMRDRIQKLKESYDRLRLGKESLLTLIDETELSESVYNSNAIENSTLTLVETEKILLEMEVSRSVSLREVFEAKNLARIIEYIKSKARSEELNLKLILLLHQMLLGNIDEKIAGRVRTTHEYVRVGTHIGSPPEHIESRLQEALIAYSSNLETFFVDKIARFHLDFEVIHPFNDGNGRIGRVLMNYQWAQLGFPPVIIREKDKKVYYRAFTSYLDDKNTRPMERIMSLALTESLYKRNTYLKGETIIPLSEYAKTEGKSLPALLNAARRQTIPAFRERGVWKIGRP